LFSRIYGFDIQPAGLDVDQSVLGGRVSPYISCHHFIYEFGAAFLRYFLGYNILTWISHIKKEGLTACIA